MYICMYMCKHIHLEIREQPPVLCLLGTFHFLLETESLVGLEVCYEG